MAKKVYLFSGNYLEKYHISVAPYIAIDEDFKKKPFKVRTFNNSITKILSASKKTVNLRVITLENGLKIALHPFDSILTDAGYVLAKDVEKYKYAIACKSPFAHTVQKESNIPKAMNLKVKNARFLYDFSKTASKEQQTELAFFLGMVMSGFTMTPHYVQYSSQNQELFESTLKITQDLSRKLLGSTPSVISKSNNAFRFRIHGKDLMVKLTQFIGRNMKRKKIDEVVQPDGSIKKIITNKSVFKKIPAFVKDGTREEKMAFVEGFLRNYTPSIVSGRIRDDLTYLLLGLGYNVRFKNYRCYLISKSANAEDVHFLSQEFLNNEYIGIPAMERVFIERQLYGNFTSTATLNENGIQSPKGLLYIKMESIETITCPDIYVFETDLQDGDTYMNYGCSIKPFGVK